MALQVELRRGITLLEVLISMFVLLIGLLGVGAMIPAGRYVAMQGTKLATSTMVGQSAMHELQVRDCFNPANWHTVNSTGSDFAIWDPTNPGKPFKIPSGANSMLLPVVIDPLGLTSFPGAIPPGAATVPAGFSAPALFLTRISPFGPIGPGTQQLAVMVCRSSDDLVSTQNSADLPPTQFNFLDASKNPIKRSSDGNYSWFATIVPDPTASTVMSEITVTVAVVHKRDLSALGSGESTTRIVSLPGAGMGGGEVLLFDPNGIAKALRPGQFVMVTGTIPNAAGPLPYFYWYRVTQASDMMPITAASQLSAFSPLPADMPSPQYQVQPVTLAGPDWTAYTPGNVLTSPPPTTSPFPTVWIFDNVISTFQTTIPLDLP